MRALVQALRYRDGGDRGDTHLDEERPRGMLTMPAQPSIVRISGEGE